MADAGSRIDSLKAEKSLLTEQLNDFGTTDKVTEDAALMAEQVSTIQSAIEAEIYAAKQAGDLHAVCDLSVHLAETLWLEQRYTESVEQYGVALNIARRVHDDDKTGMILAGKGFVLLNLGEHIDAVLSCCEFNGPFVSLPFLAVSLPHPCPNNDRWKQTMSHWR